MGKISRKIFLCVLAFVAATAHSEPTGNPANVTVVRPYLQSGTIYVTVTDPSPCATDTYRIELNDLGAKEAYAAVLLALSINKKIKIEVSNSEGCKGWASRVQSIHLLSN